MHLQDKVIVVTGGGNGIGAACCQRFAKESPRGVVVADIDETSAKSVAESIGGVAVACDVSSERDVRDLVATAEAAYGPIDLFFSNAGIVIPGGVEVTDEDWRQMIDVNFMAHLYAIRAVLPGMLQRGGGYLVHTSSAAGLLTEMSSAPYAVTKHAVVSLAEWIAIEYGDRGIKVCCLCPQGVRTQMLEGGEGPVAKMLWESSVSPEEVAQCVLQAILEEQFLALPHPEVADYFVRKATDYDRWLRGMRRLKDRIDNETA